VKLAVYDILGREVAILVNERKNSGRYEVRWDASGLPSGMYICRMAARQTAGGPAGTFTGVMKMILVR
jgi:hypothetical protein